MGRRGYTAAYRRVYLVYVLFFIFGGVIIARLAQLQIVSSANYREHALAAQQYGRSVSPQRGEIFAQDKNHAPVALAQNTQFENVYAVPALVPAEARAPLAQELSQILGLSVELVTGRLSKAGDPYEPLKEKITPAEKAALQALGHPAIGFETAWGRTYPLEQVSAKVVGFLGYSRTAPAGQYGIEGTYENELKGSAGLAKGEKDSLGRLLIPFGLSEQAPAENGADIVLTIDANISREAYYIAEELRAKYSAKAAAVLVMNPRTGAIAALESAPSFDPNNYAQAAGEQVFLNPLTQEPYEPGSIFKPVTMAAGLDLAEVSPLTTYEDPGVIRFGTYTIKNFDGKAHGLKTMTEVLALSLNTGAVFVERRVGNDQFRAYVEAFGFGEKTGLNFPESAGNIKNLSSGRDINYATAAFGQGIAVTPLQVARAFAAIANGGNLVTPYIVDRLIRADGTIEVHEPTLQRKVIAQATAKTLTEMLVAVVERGFDRRAAVPGYRLAGKTGTAQIPNPAGGYYEDIFIHSFVGFGPVANPRFVIFIKLDEPQGVTFSSYTTPPAFARLAKFLLTYYEIPPTEKTK